MSRIIKSDDSDTWDEDTRNFQENVERALVGRAITKIDVEVVDQDFSITLDNGAMLRFSNTWVQWDEYGSVETSLIIQIEIA